MYTPSRCLWIFPASSFLSTFFFSCALSDRVFSCQMVVSAASALRGLIQFVILFHVLPAFPIDAASRFQKFPQ
ncbi:hypothetical protein EDB87DRAFT_97932 [Lactarius vividus]|nr:hypothetical protein EDB87DRAFT_97932 [Lactarius vividus]